MLKNIQIFLTLIVILVVGVGAAYIGYSFSQKKNSGTYINTSRAAILKEIKQLNRLETASFTMEKIVDAGTKENPVQQFLFGDKLILIAHGEVIAGFDLAGLTEKDIDINTETKTLSITLPKAQILVSRLDNEQTTIYDRTTGLFTKGDKELETKARDQAEKSIRDAACKGQILKIATDNARKQLTALFGALGFTSVEIRTEEATCQ
jgi:hypothetical protein